jgi:hypothetical protein
VEVLYAKAILFEEAEVRVFWGYHQTMAVEEVVSKDVLMVSLMNVVHRGNHLVNRET